MRRTAVVAFVLSILAPAARAEVWVRWREGALPERAALGVAVVVVAPDEAPARAAVAKGYRVFLESDAARAAEIAAKAKAAGAAGVAVFGAAAGAKLPPSAIEVDESGKWPRMRSLNVARGASDAVQRAARTRQPWLDTNVAEIRLLQGAGRRPVLAYRWKPDSPSSTQAGPTADELALAIAEAGAFGAVAVVDLEPRFLDAWSSARAALDFYAPQAVAGAPLSNVGVVVRDAAAWYEVLNLMARHNVHYRVLQSVDARAAADLDLVVLTEPGAAAPGVPPERILRAGDDAAALNAFALKVWNQVGRKRRLADIWNGITVLVGLQQGADGRSLRVDLVNYSTQPLPVQVRVRGLFTRAEYAAPGRKPEPLPVERIEGATEFVVPELRIGGTVVLNP